jgi:hypothetical protein
MRISSLLSLTVFLIILALVVYLAIMTGPLG